MKSNKSLPINIVVPLWNRAKHIKLLLNNINNIIKNTNETQVSVYIADFHSTDINLEEYIKLSNFQFSVIIVCIDLPFIIGKGLQIAAERIDPLSDCLIYFCDADCVFPLVIFQRIREFVTQSKTFYAPIVSRELRDGSIARRLNKGGKGCIGVHNFDFVKSKGWRYSRHYNVPKLKDSAGPMERTEWGKHDTHIFNVLSNKMRLECIRYTELDQWVRFHERSQWYSTS